MNSKVVREAFQISYEECEDAVETENEKVAIEEPSNIGRLTSFLRFLGGVILVGSAVTFLVQGWSGFTALHRIIAFLGFSSSLVLAGFLCGLRIREDKGARVFLGISLAFAPVHFLQLAALIRSFFYSKPESIQQLFLLKAGTTAEIMIATSLIAVVTIPSIFVGFSSLARKHARLLTGLFIASNALLLLPFRTPTIVALLVVVATNILLLGNRKLFSASIEMQTLEGRYARALLVLPMFLILIRNCVLYSTTATFFAILFAAMAQLLFQMPRFMKTKFAEAIQPLSIIPAVFAWIIFVHGCLYEGEITFIYNALRLVREQLVVPLIALPAAAICYFLALGMQPIAARNVRRLASTAATASMVLQLVSQSGLLSSFLLVITAILIVVQSFINEERVSFYLGTFSLAIGLLSHLRYAKDLIMLSPWLSLGITGTLIIIGASYLEKNFETIRDRYRTLHLRINAWS